MSDRRDAPRDARRDARRLIAAALVALAAGGAGADAAEIGTPRQSPIATLLYQNFPNPFPGAGVAAANAALAAGAPATCIWFDLGRPSPVRLEVYTLRGDRVRVLLPSPALSGVLPANRYGRAPGGGVTGCDPQLTWDGRADDGRIVPAGVYLLRLQADGASQVRKIVFRGR